VHLADSTINEKLKLREKKLKLARENRLEVRNVN